MNLKNSFIILIAVLGTFIGAKDCDLSVDGPVTVHVVQDDAGNVTVSNPPCEITDAGFTDAGFTDSGQCVQTDSGPSTPWFGPGLCPVPQYYPLDGGGQRVAVAGDSMANSLFASLSQALRGHQVDNYSIGGVKIADLPNVPGTPAWVVLSIGTNDLGSGNPAAVNSGIDNWTAAQVANGHRIWFTMLPRRGDIGFPTQGEPTRQGINAHLGVLGAPSIVGDPWLDLVTSPDDRLCYQLDRVHNNTYCAGIRIAPVRAQMEACP